MMGSAIERGDRDLTGDDEDAAITSIATYALAVPLARPIADSTAALSHWIVPVVEIRTADGRTGTGISGVHCGPELLCAVIDNYYAPALVGNSAADILGTWKRLYRLPTHWIGRAGAVHMALAMVDIALWDLAAQRAGVPLWRLLGGTADPVEAYNTDGGWLNFSVDELVRDLTSLIDQGWRRVKMKVGHPDWREDARRVRAVRSQIGDDVTLMCDANQRWDLYTANLIMPVLEEARMDWVEEPFHPDDLENHRRLQRSTRIDIAAGESIYSYQQFGSFIAADALRVVQVDATRVAGVTEWRRSGLRREPRSAASAARRRHDASPPAPRRDGALRGPAPDRVHSVDASGVHRAKPRARRLSGAAAGAGRVHGHRPRRPGPLAASRDRARQDSLTLSS